MSTEAPCGHEEGLAVSTLDV